MVIWATYSKLIITVTRISMFSSLQTQESFQRITLGLSLLTLSKLMHIVHSVKNQENKKTIFSGQYISICRMNMGICRQTEGNSEPCQTSTFSCIRIEYGVLHIQSECGKMQMFDRVLNTPLLVCTFPYSISGRQSINHIKFRFVMHLQSGKYSKSEPAFF